MNIAKKQRRLVFRFVHQPTSKLFFVVVVFFLSVSVFFCMRYLTCIFSIIFFGSGFFLCLCVCVDRCKRSFFDELISLVNQLFSLFVFSRRHGQTVRGSSILFVWAQIIAILVHSSLSLSLHLFDIFIYHPLRGTKRGASVSKMTIMGSRGL